MFHTIRVGLLLALLWLVLSGHFDPLLLSLGVVSVCLSAWISHRMDVADHETFMLRFGPGLVLYWLWLLREIVHSNIDVTRHILRPQLAITPTIRRVPATQGTELGRVIFANSITLTPGTVSLEVERQHILIHAISRDAAAGLAEGDMDRRVTALESK